MNVPSDGTEAAGTSLWMAGPATSAERIAPIITEAAMAAGRPAPRILARDEDERVHTRELLRALQSG